MHYAKLKYYILIAQVINNQIDAKNIK